METGVDTAIQRIDTAYDTGGRPYLFTSYSTPAGGSGNIVNQVQAAFNGLGQLTAEYQSHSGAVNTGTTPVVQYAYTQMSGGVNNSRLVSMTYPNSRIEDYGYNTATGSAGLDDRISRLSSIADDNNSNPQTVESYSYLGLGTVVLRNRPVIGISLTYLAPGGPSDAGDQYTGLDRFGRVVDQAWKLTSPPPPVYNDRFQYGYDRAGNVLYKSNLVNTSFSELYHANGAGNGYDGFNELVSFSRGTLNPTNNTITGTPSRSQTWTLDAMGNWTSVTSTVNGTPTTQNATFNAQNEVATYNGQGGPAYDNNGNMTTDQNGQQNVFDAWNRMVAVKNSSGTTLETYANDALGRRIQENVPGGTSRDLYYNDAWQVVEERETPNGGSTVVRSQYVWDPLASDTLILRDRDPNGVGSFTERLYVQQDANGNVTAVVDGKSSNLTFGQVIERYIEDPYGQTSFLDPSTWTVHGGGSNGTSSVNWIYLHQAGRYDTVSGLYNFRHRDSSPTLGRWMQLDPMRYEAEDNNLYRDESNSPSRNSDPSGLFAKTSGLAVATCDITDVVFVDDEESIPQYVKDAGVKFRDIYKGKFDPNTPGPFHDPDTGEAEFVFWVIFKGSGLQDCEFRRYYASTTTVGDEGIPLIQPEGGPGFIPGAKITAGTGEPDGPDPDNIIFTPTFAVLMDAPGLKPVPDQRFDRLFPVVENANFFINVFSKTTFNWAARVWYDTGYAELSREALSYILAPYNVAIQLGLCWFSLNWKIARFELASKG